MIEAAAGCLFTMDKGMPDVPLSNSEQIRVQL